MLIHIGAGYLAKDKDIVGIFDLDGDVTPAVTTEYLKKAQKRGITDSAGCDLPRSFILCENRQMGEKVVLSHISSSSIGKRALKGNG